ncbi:carbon-nitrogen hydrolase family protein [Nocardiopsis sp. YSL2]|uniref:carbon-nitrogen hydrolase family protein n=1 Tax=Nocardiopsis sp. YSL2 TaxID=2939492 RepID=UPI0026F47169|nr:carbon-nitrogen hydrolase family protein [Nocardiopsis sp. YSL2]
MRIALAQHRAAVNDPDANLKRGLDICREAAAEGTDLLVFPEMWSTGYGTPPRVPDARAAWEACAMGPDSQWLEAFRRSAREHDMAVVVTYLQGGANGLGNAATLIDRQGRDLLTYTKVHTCDFTWEEALTPGGTFDVVRLDTGADHVDVGIMLCFDREFPEASRALALGGAELVVTPNACLLCDDRIGQFRARAFENMAAHAMANYPAPRMNGRSCVFDGMAFRDGRPRDHCLAEADHQPGMVLIDLDLRMLRHYRSTQVWGPNARHPGAYRRLTERS